MSEITVPLGEQNLVAHATVLDQNREPMPAPAIPAWTSFDRNVILPHPAPDGLSARLETIGAGDAVVMCETGSPEVGIIRGTGVVHVVPNHTPTSVVVEFTVS